MEIIPAWEVIQEQLERFSRSDQLSRSKRLMRFLRFSVEQTLAGHPEVLTEHGIGTAVYDRAPDFDPNVDGIVRVEARRLRTKLEEYYRDAGRQDPLIIEYPLGSYVPSFRNREADFLPSQGRIVELIQSMDWSGTPLGPIPNWSRNLKIVLGISLRMRLPQAICWGPERIVFYNEAMHDLLGPAYEKILGKPAGSAPPEVALEGIPGLASILVSDLGKDDSATLTNERCLIQRTGYREETYFTTSCSPILGGDWRVSGVLLTAAETTQMVLAERRLKTLNDLSERGLVPVNPADACHFAASVLQHNPHDIPFASIYLFEEDRKSARLHGTAGVEAGFVLAPQRIPLGEESWTLLAEAAAAGTHQVLQVQDKLGPLPSGAWQTSPREVAVLPIQTPGQTLPAGFVIAGVNPHRRLDQEYRTFFESVASRIGDMIGHARVAGDEESRKAMINENEAKRISFLTAAGDELRTPLTLVHGLLDEAAANNQLVPGQKAQLKIAHRNVLRLLRLVDGLVAYGRLQSGQLDTVFEPVDLSSVTSELAGTMRSAIETAGIDLVVDCPPLPDEVYVDRMLWEEIVLNLLTNAYRKTSSGEIGIRLRPTGAWVELAVWDTGSGIAAEHLSRIFDPFYQTPAPTGRQQEGGGLGLTLVREFLKLHGGDIKVQSEEDRGTTFTVLIPRGKAHLPANRISAKSGEGQPSASLRSLTEQVLHWTEEQALPVNASALEDGTQWRKRTLVGPAGGHIIVAAPDSDLRHYLKYLLSEMYTVETVSQGKELLGILQQNGTDLVIVDAATSKPNGAELLRSVRSAAKSIPIILMSASRDERDRLRALSSGADDYLVKPFTARELIVRVQSQFAQAELRRAAAETERQLRTEAESKKALLEGVLDQMPTALMLLDIPTGVVIRANRAMKDLFGDALNLYTDVNHYPEGIILHRDGRPCKKDDCLLVRAVRTGEPGNEEIIFPHPSGTRYYFKTTCEIVRDREGKPVAVVVALQDVTEFEIAKEASMSSVR